ncbi:hypothetical protein [Fodinicola feengrottensis]|uniref:hypothetical protein n=1 Tax=Fodinicola feengrottensis TaxID=435914 RepID=UPI002442BB45|nr:hypothetical protein [Fodinicola feengrottensis]
MNILVGVIATFICKALKAPDGVDATKPRDYEVEAGDLGVRDVPGLVEGVKAT